MNLQTLKSKLNKGQKDQTIEVILNVDNQEHVITGISQTPDKLIITGTLSEGIHAGDSIENQSERSEQEAIEEATPATPEVPEAEAAVDQMYGMDVEEETSTAEPEEGADTSSETEDDE